MLILEHYSHTTITILIHSIRTVHKALDISQKWEKLNYKVEHISIEAVYIMTWKRYKESSSGMIVLRL